MSEPIVEPSWLGREVSGVKVPKPPYSAAEQELITQRYTEWISDNKTYVEQAGWRSDLSGDAAADNEAVTGYAPKGVFKEDYLEYCKLLNTVPHPAILPSLKAPSSFPDSPPAEPELEEGEEAPEPSDDQYDMSEVTAVKVKGWQIDAANLSALTLALKADQSITALILSDGGLSQALVLSLADGLSGTGLTSLTLEWNTSPIPEEQDGDISECYAVFLDGKKGLPYSSLC